LEQELNRARAELSILYEISSAMRTTLQLDEILYIILTGVTSHVGLGFNRAMLFLIKNDTIEGQMGIGPSTGEEADRIWRYIKSDDLALEDFIESYKKTKKIPDSSFNSSVRKLILPLYKKEGGLLRKSALDTIPIHITRENIIYYKSDPLFKILGSDTQELLIVPLRAKDKVNGLIVADNLFTQKPITQDDMRVLIMLANQAGLAIENSHLYEKTVQKSHTDSLTNLWNHGYFQYKLQEEIEKAKIIKSSLSLIMIDIDFFKNYNDSFGHQTGDKLLGDISKLLQDHSRKIDYVCRYGGEEFSIILPQTHKKDAYAIAERLREVIQNYKFSYPDTPEQKITISLGLASYPEDAGDKAELLTLADKALFNSKKAGRNTTSQFRL
jgi:diguanylate cyclase (GGDEF)-like protein